MHNHLFTFARWRRALLAAMCLSASCLAAAASEVDDVMFVDPLLPPLPETAYFSPKLKPLWLEALVGPEANLRRQAADAIARAHEAGFADMSDCAPNLLNALNNKEESRLVKLSCARALTVIDAKHAAPQLAAYLRTEGLEAALHIEPALARWDHQGTRKIWLTRLESARVSTKRRVLAIQGLATVGEQSAVSSLADIAINHKEPASIRLEATRALAVLQTAGLEGLARRLAADKSNGAILNRLISASLLTEHRGEETEAILLELAVDSEPSVAAIALRRLLAIDPALIAPISERVVRSSDPQVRQLCAQALVEHPTVAGIELLGLLLNDPHPDVRNDVRKSLTELAGQESLRQAILDEGVSTLAGENWRGLEQAALLLTALDYEPAADRLIELLNFDRPEVMVVSAWGLRRLAIPETLPTLLEHAQQQTESMRSVGYVRARDKQLSQLFQAFGSMDYAPADELLRGYVPKAEFYGFTARLAAVWALGKIHAGNPQPDLVEQLAERLLDLSPIMPELTEVRVMSAVAIGKMNAVDGLPALRKVIMTEGVSTEPGQACGWAIQQITGEEPQKPGITVRATRGWFLEPVD